MKRSLANWEWWAWGGMTALGIGLVFFRIAHHSLWSDEAVTMAMTDHGYLDILRFGKGDSHPPLYHLAIKAFTDLLGHGRGVFRSFSALGLLATALLLGAGPVSRVFNNRRVGLLYAFLMLFASMNLTQAQEMRMYTWATFLVAASATQGYLYVRDGKPRDLLLFALASLGGAYIHYYVTLGVAFIHLYLLVWIIVARRERLWPFLGEAVGVALLFLPWVFTLATQVSRNVKHFWIAKPTLETLLAILTVPFSVKTGIVTYATFLALSCLGCFAYGLVQARKKRSELLFPLLAAVVFLAVLLVAWVFSLTLRPIIVPRYLQPLWGLLFMGVAWGLAQVFAARGWRGVALGSAFLLLYALLAIPSLNLLYFYQLNGPMDEVRQFGEKNFRPGQAFLHFDENTTPVFVKEFPEYPHLVYQGPTSIFYDTFDYFGDKVRVVTDLQSVAASYERLWVVTSPDSQNSGVAAEVAARLGIDPGKLVTWEEGAGMPPGSAISQGGGIRFATIYSDFIVDLAPVSGRYTSATTIPDRP